MEASLPATPLQLTDVWNAVMDRSPIPSAIPGHCDVRMRKRMRMRMRCDSRPFSIPLGKRCPLLAASDSRRRHPPPFCSPRPPLERHFLRTF